MGNCSRNPPLQTKLETRVLELGLQTDMREGVRQGWFPWVFNFDPCVLLYWSQARGGSGPAVGNREWEEDTKTPSEYGGPGHVLTFEWGYLGTILVASKKVEKWSYWSVLLWWLIPLPHCCQDTQREWSFILPLLPFYGAWNYLNWGLLGNGFSSWHWDSPFFLTVLTLYKHLSSRSVFALLSCATLGMLLNLSETRFPCVKLRQVIVTAPNVADNYEDSMKGMM